MTSWDYLIVTASNQKQASAYENQLQLRQELGLLSGVGQVLVVPDPENRRIGSGGSTLYSLQKVLAREKSQNWLETLQNLRILIIHAGGDSQRLPAYSPCGKLFTPTPGESDNALGSTLFDRQFPLYTQLPAMPDNSGQILVTTGDVLLGFNPLELHFSTQGITGVGCQVTPEIAQNHGVFCSHPDADDRVRLFLQKPSLEQQKRMGAINRYGQSTLDIGILNFDAATAIKLLKILIKKENLGEGALWESPLGREIFAKGLDLYREICCAMGTDTDYPSYLEAVRASGARIEETGLKTLYTAVSQIPFHVQILARCGFLHFGTMPQLIKSGTELTRQDRGLIPHENYLDINNTFSGQGSIAGIKSWVEGCRLEAGLLLEGENAVVGADITEPLSLPKKACLDIIKGHAGHSGEAMFFFRIYGIDDSIKTSVQEKETTICSIPAHEWTAAMEAREKDIWAPDIDVKNKTLWNAKIYPCIENPGDLHKWLWLYRPNTAGSAEKAAWKKAERYSFAEMALLADQDDFYTRRWLLRFRELRKNIHWIFRPQSRFSAAELAFLLKNTSDSERINWIRDVLEEAHRLSRNKKRNSSLEQFEFSRIFHSLASALKILHEKNPEQWSRVLSQTLSELNDQAQQWLTKSGLGLEKGEDTAAWCQAAQDAAFKNLSQTIVLSQKKVAPHPAKALRRDEIIWGRAPARLDLGGGWTDTPPYALERGGCVINAAVNLNGQPPIHAYARCIEQPEIRITSIDHGASLTITEWEELFDYRKATSRFGLAKAALVLSGFSPEKAKWPKNCTNLKDILLAFGGGIELTTLAAIPSGSGLGTSSIMGAVLVSVISRLIGTKLSRRELFHLVLQLEQELTTGGGWQDQVGGSIGGVKIIRTEPGMVPDPQIQYTPADVLDPSINQGQTLLYYTGIRRLAKNILRYVVGNYLDRSRYGMETLRNLHQLAPRIAEAMAGKDIQKFGELIDVAWNLNKRIDPDSSTPVIEGILEKLSPFIYGTKLLGAGGGGFLLIVCKSPQDAAAARELLEKNPPNDLARFFSFEISTSGLEVTVC